MGFISFCIEMVSWFTEGIVALIINKEYKKDVKIIENKIVYTDELALARAEYELRQHKL
jgi:hypothetical protein